MADLSRAFHLAWIWVASAALLAAAQGARAGCIAERPTAMVPADLKICRELEPIIRKPSALSLGDYEGKLNRYLGSYCYRDQASGWVHDKYVRQAGPRIATLINGAWQGKDFGTHAPVMIWYSPDMADWLRKNRPADGEVDHPPAVPDGAIMIKEMFSEPASDCRDVDPLKLFPTSGAAVMIRDAGASYDGWFWGWYGFGSQSGWTPDWPALPTDNNSLPNMGFAQYCMNCHASAADNLTFASPKNIAGEPGKPLNYLSQDFFTATPAPTLHQTVVLPTNAKPRLGEPLYSANADVVAALKAYVRDMPTYGNVPKMPSETYDNTWVGAKGPDASDTFLTSSQCLGCHDAGSTGLQFDMTQPNPHGDGLVNLSPFATWRTSPMGLGGRDPIFFAQLASETQSFHPKMSGVVQDVCLGCHGIGGERQFHIDQKAKSGQCEQFTRAMVDTLPWPPGNPGAAHANYGMLARDGITCTTCHRMVINSKASEPLAGQPQNACVEDRQALLNPHASGFAKTFTGSFMVGSSDTLIGPFEKPEVGPMHTALGIKPVHDATILSSEVCGTCHTVHLPVLKGETTLAHIYEQTTYPEWAFSAYRTGSTPDGPLPMGPGATPQSCQGCHMSSKDPDGSPTTSKIASIQEMLNFPQAESSNAPDLEARKGFARHTLVGLNVFLVKMAQQFPDVFGIRTRDPMMGTKAVDPLVLTEQAMLDQAAQATATVAVSDLSIGADMLDARVTVKNMAGHKFPSGVGFRRAFLTFSVLDQNGQALWVSGRTNAAGVITDADGKALDGELWWKDDCSGRLHPGERPHQPHYQKITRQDQVQIYQELVSTPPANTPNPICNAQAKPEGELTTSFLSICTEVKDNRILPAGFLPVASRIEIAKALGADEELAVDVGTTAVEDDPDYVDGSGSDSLTYSVPLADLPKGARPANVEANLYYQATPPSFLQDRFCTAKGPDTDRLYFLAGHLNLAGTAADGWKLKVVGSGTVAVAAQP